MQPFATTNIAYISTSCVGTPNDWLNANWTNILLFLLTKLLKRIHHRDPHPHHPCFPHLSSSYLASSLFPQYLLISFLGRDDDVPSCVYSSACAGKLRCNSRQRCKGIFFSFCLTKESLSHKLNKWCLGRVVLWYS